MKTNWRSYFDLPLNVREEMYKRGVDDEIENFRQFEKALKGDPEEPEEDNFIEEEDLEFSEEQNGKITIVKGDDNTMEFTDLREAIEAFIGEPVEEEFFEIEKRLSETNRKALVEAVNTLNRYKKEITKNKELKTSLLTLARFIGFGAGYPAPVKKELEGEPEIFDWKSFVEHMSDDEDIEEEIEKADPDDKFPSLTKGLLKGQRRRDKALSERDISMGRRFI